MGVVNVMLLPPQIGHHQRGGGGGGEKGGGGTPLLQHRLAVVLSPPLSLSRRRTRRKSGILLTRVPGTIVSLVLVPLLLLLLSVCSARAAAAAASASVSGENVIPAQSVANNNLRFNNNGLATAAAAAGTASLPSSPSDTRTQNLNSMNSGGGSSYSPSNSNTASPGSKGTRKTLGSHPVSGSSQDPATTSHGSSSATFSSSSRSLDPHPSSPVATSQHSDEDNNQVAPKSKLEGESITNVTSQFQTHTYLPCKLSSALLKQKQIANKSVSWVRVRDDHILTVNRITFITDDRFQSYYSEANGVWTLQIKYVQPRDEGIYECQVSTEPKVSAQVQLNVIVPKTELVGEPIRYVKDGSNAILRCVVRGALEPPIYISWFYGSKQIYNDSPRGWKITLERDVLDNEHDGSHSSIGSLIITSVRKRDTGNYTCKPSNSDEVTVMLHVINGEYSASAITSSSSRGRFSDLIVTVIISVVMFEMT